jgi:hypothetical protein
LYLGVFWCDLSENGLSFVLNLGCIIVCKTTKIITSKKIVHNGPLFGAFSNYTVNANKYHVNTILIIFQAYLFTVPLIIHSEILRKIQFWKE